MSLSGCDPCDKLFVLRHRGRDAPACPHCQRQLRPADQDEFLARYHAQARAAAFRFRFSPLAAGRRPRRHGSP
jgi:hypothetical protein